MNKIILFIVVIQYIASVTSQHSYAPGEGEYLVGKMY